jgi:hypothetical protein
LGQPVQLVLIFHGDAVEQVQRVDAGVLAAAGAHAAAWRAHVAARPTQVEADFGQVVEAGLEVVGGRAQQDDVAGSAVHIGQPAAVLIPHVTQLAQLVGGVEPTGRHGHPKGMELGHRRKFIGQVRVAADHPAAIALDADDTTVLPVADSVLV